MPKPTKAQIEALSNASVEGHLWRVPGGWWHWADSFPPKAINSNVVAACERAGWLERGEFLDGNTRLTKAGRAVLAEIRRHLKLTHL